MIQPNIQPLTGAKHIPGNTGIVIYNHTIISSKNSQVSEEQGCTVPGNVLSASPAGSGLQVDTADLLFFKQNSISHKRFKRMLIY